MSTHNPTIWRAPQKDAFEGSICVVNNKIKTIILTKNAILNRGSSG